MSPWNVAGRSRWAAWCLRRYRPQTHRAMRMRIAATAPPSAPPIIAPKLFDFFVLPVGVGAGVEVASNPAEGEVNSEETVLGSVGREAAVGVEVSGVSVAVAELKVPEVFSVVLVDESEVAVTRLVVFALVLAIR
ncbi:hypothetical protein GYMLUDRAFT_49173 [Collybiopsis luxurians FD-317 M1]|uniref:Uncharacterized protein n=1 Tax=Collybiopsis luxurians FD-317 M1 TaxID=944289 RepID=A0A0D0CFZ7_9AGAR|nr:hypothetical protein GYMLUDRAFT_49173 [Collybiopsis luxurians FD-317 M1]